MLKNLFRDLVFAIVATVLSCWLLVPDIQLVWIGNCTWSIYLDFLAGFVLIVTHDQTL